MLASSSPPFDDVASHLSNEETCPALWRFQNAFTSKYLSLYMYMIYIYVCIWYIYMCIYIYVYDIYIYIDIYIYTDNVVKPKIPRANRDVLHSEATPLPCFLGWCHTLLLVHLSHPSVSPTAFSPANDSNARFGEDVDIYCASILSASEMCASKSQKPKCFFHQSLPTSADLDLLRSGVVEATLFTPRKTPSVQKKGNNCPTWRVDWTGEVATIPSQY